MSATDWRHGVGVNDLTEVTTKMYPEVRHHLELLDELLVTCRGGTTDDICKRARMTGTGGCVFAEFEDQKSAQDALRRLSVEVKGWVAEGLDQHPLADLESCAP